MDNECKPKAIVRMASAVVQAIFYTAAGAHIITAMNYDFFSMQMLSKLLMATASICAGIMIRVELNRM